MLSRPDKFRVVIADAAWYTMMRGALEDGHKLESLYRLAGEVNGNAFVRSVAVIQTARREPESVCYGNEKVKRRMDCYDQSISTNPLNGHGRLIGEGHIHPCGAFSKDGGISDNDKGNILYRMKESGLDEWVEIIHAVQLRKLARDGHVLGERFVRYPKRVRYTAVLERGKKHVEVMDVASSAFLARINSDVVREVPVVFEEPRKYINPATMKPYRD